MADYGIPKNFLVDEVRKTFDLFKPAGTLTEIRLLSNLNKNRNQSIYVKSFDDLLKAVRNTKGLDEYNFYFVLNEIDEDCYYKVQRDRFVYGATTTSDGEITKRIMLLIDFDPKRKGGISSTIEELKKAIELSEVVKSYLTEQGFSDPAECASGNGRHLLYRIDLDATDESRDIIKQFLSAIANRFDNEFVDIDISTFNASRICKLYGTLAMKGANTEDRPHRFSNILNVPKDWKEKPITKEQLTAIISANAELVKEQPKATAKMVAPSRVNKANASSNNCAPLDIKAWMENYGLSYREKAGTDCTIYELDACPFDSTHTNGDSKIFQYTNGALAFKCHHNHCLKYKWQDVRLLYEPNAYQNIREVSFDVTEEGKIKKTANNFLNIMKGDYFFKNLKYNKLRHYPEKVFDDYTELWTDADDAKARLYIEKKYGLMDMSRYSDAIQTYLEENSYNPLTDYLDSLEWNGKPIAVSMLHKWMKCDDTPYTRECSRLLYASAIRRAYENGAKVDVVIVLIGKQGAGKSTFVEEQAMKSKWYTSAKTITGQKGREAIAGMWIVELEELLAVIANEKAGTKVEENAKAFLSTKVDYYRLPYAHRPEEIPRTNIFIGTTNRDEFLTDKTGNRRWFPIRCNADGYDIFDHIEELREDIKQAWAEMRDAYKKHLPLANPYPNKEMISEIRTEQAGAEMEDWRIGVIEEFVAEKDRVCCLQIYREALYDGNFKKEMSNKEAREIGEILVNKLGWVRCNAERFADYGKQKAFRKIIKEFE